MKIRRTALRLHDTSEKVESNTAAVKALCEVTKSMMHHGAEVDDVRLALAFATIATVLAQNTHKYSWVTDASWDRILTVHAETQWSGARCKTENGTEKQGHLRIAGGSLADVEPEVLGVASLNEGEGILSQISGDQNRKCEYIFTYRRRKSYPFEAGRHLSGNKISGAENELAPLRPVFLQKEELRPFRGGAKWHADLLSVQRWS